MRWATEEDLRRGGITSGRLVDGSGANRSLSSLEAQGGHPMNQLRIAYVLAVMVLTAMLNTPALAEPHHAKLVGVQEVPVVVSAGTGQLKMTVADDDSSIEFELTYEGLEGGTVQQAHIHVGQKNVNGGVVIFLCTSLTPPPAGVPAPPACPDSPGKVTGTRTAADVL